MGLNEAWVRRPDVVDDLLRSAAGWCGQKGGLIFGGLASVLIAGSMQAGSPRCVG